jgi:hypothetical protein
VESLERNAGEAVVRHAKWTVVVLSCKVNSAVVYSHESGEVFSEATVQLHVQI